MSLSVKSIASWSCVVHEHSNLTRKMVGRVGRLTFATPRFSIAGILWPACPKYDINGAHPKSVVSFLFSLYAPLRSNSRSLRGFR